MIERIKKYFLENEKVVILGLALFFIAVRLFGVELPLHQDEYKWPMIVNPSSGSEISIPHPPLSQFIYRTAGYIVGFNTNFRFVPLFFGTINLLLLYYLVRFVWGRKEATIASLIWVFSYFSVLASLMVDTDGEIMPFFFLSALISYYKLKNSKGNIFWYILLAISMIGGFFIKVSFMLSIVAIVADYLWERRRKFSKRELLKYFGYAFAGIIFLALLLLGATYIFSYFNLGQSIKYWEHFATFNRNWFQTAIQCFKALLYASPFLVLIPFWGGRKIFSKAKPLIFFLFFALIFYIFLFDFSLGALDRYLQLVILPLVLLCSLAITQVFDGQKTKKSFIVAGLVISIILIAMQFLPHFIPSLHPKTEWISRVVNLKWNFVYPFSGGSGPLGFYVSFLFISLSWIFSLTALVLSKIKPEYKKSMLVFVIIIGFAYNLVFVEEYLFGKINGYAPKLLFDSIQFIANNPDIKMVTSYNDNGGNEIRNIGKYRKRLYVDPKFDLDDKINNLNKYKEHYFVLDVPKIDQGSVYQKYFDSCSIIFREVDRKMSATIYDCRKAPDIKI